MLSAANLWQSLKNAVFLPCGLPFNFLFAACPDFVPAPCAWLLRRSGEALGICLVQTNCQPTCHGDLGDLPYPPHHQVKVSTAPFRKTAHRNLGRLHQREAQHRTPLFGDVPQTALVPTGVLQWNRDRDSWPPGSAIIAWICQKNKVAKLAGRLRQARSGCQDNRFQMGANTPSPLTLHCGPSTY